MKESDVRARAFAMPLTSPAYPIGPYRFVNREFLIITYRTDPQKLRELVPELASAIEEVVLKALAKDPQQRFVDVQDLVVGGNEDRFGAALYAALRARDGLFRRIGMLAFRIGDDAAPFAGKCRQGTKRR